MSYLKMNLVVVHWQVSLVGCPWTLKKGRTHDLGGLLCRIRAGRRKREREEEDPEAGAGESKSRG